MFTGLVVDNFAYVFQLFGKVKAIDREEGKAIISNSRSKKWGCLYNINIFLIFIISEEVQRSMG
jgi:hypothetical protein